MKKKKKTWADKTVESSSNNNYQNVKVDKLHTPITLSELEMKMVS